jgi:uncharacterized protein YkwD
MFFNKAIAIALSASLLTSGAVMTSEILTTTPAYAAISDTDQQAAVNKILNDTNAARAENNLPPLKLSAGVSVVAQKWSEKMGESGSMTHNPEYFNQMPSGWYGAAENVAYGYTVNNVVPAWMNSEGHRRNILGNYNFIGIGYYVDANGRAWYTQNFGYYPNGIPSETTPTPTPTPEPTPEPTPTVDPATLAEVSPPTQLAVTAAPTALRVNWNKPATVVGKLVRYEVTTTSNGYSRTFQTLTNTVTFANLNPETAYTVKVTAFVTSLDGKTSVTSFSDTTTTTLKAPVNNALVAVTEPKNLVAATTLNTAAVTWEPSTVTGKLTGYTVTATAPDGTETKVQTTETKADFADLKAGTKYTFTVTAEAVSNDGMNRKTATASVEAETKPVPADETGVSVTKPGNLTAATNDTSARINWESSVVVGSLTRYVVTAQGENGYTRTQYTKGNQVVFAGLNPSTKFTFTVTAEAVSKDGTNKASAVGSVEASTKVGVVTNASVSVSQVKEVTAVATPTSVRVRWVAPDVIGNFVRYSVTAKNENGFSRTFYTTTPEVVYANLDSNTKYTFDIVAEAVSKDGMNKRSSLTIVEATTGVKVVSNVASVSAVQNLEAFSNNSSIRTTWTKPAVMVGTLTRYTINVKSVDGTYNRTLLTMGETASVVGLDSNKAYTVTVTATVISESRNVEATSPAATVDISTKR